MVRVTLIRIKMREDRLRWFGHVYHKSANAAVERTYMVTVEDNTKGSIILRASAFVDAKMELPK